jgi:hypothetical protein
MEAKRTRNKKIYDEVTDRIDKGLLLKDACEFVGRQNEKSVNAVKMCYYRQGGNKTSSHGNSLLSFRQNALLLGLVLAFSAINNPLTPQELKENMEPVVGFTMSDSALYMWIERHELEIRKRKSKKLAKKRATTECLDHVAQFCASLEGGISNFVMQKNNCINYDETRVVMSSGSQIRLERFDKNRPEALGKREEMLGTVIPFVSAAGEVIMSVIIFKAKEVRDDGLGKVDYVLPDESYCLRGRHPRFFAVTTSGYTNTPLNKQIIEKFVEIWNLHHPGLHCYVFSDQLASHFNMEIVKSALLKNVFLWMLPRNTSHFLQPLDDVCFARFKQVIHKRLRQVEFRGLLSHVDYTDEFYHVLYEIEQSVLTPRVIQRSFINCGLFPFSSERMISLAERNIGIYTSKDPTLAEEASRAMVRVLTVNTDHPAVVMKRKRGVSEINQLFSPHAKVLLHDTQIAEHVAKKRKKDEDKKQKERDKEAHEKAKVEGRYMKTCRDPSCEVTSRGGKSWTSCNVCDALFCAKHPRYIRDHECNVRADPQA